MRIFLTGASGFIGSELAKRLVARGHVVYALSRDDSFVHNTTDGVDYVRGDLLEAAALKTYLKNILPDVVVHLAAYTPVRFSFDNPQAYTNINYVGTCNLVDAALSIEGVKRFVYASTAEIYGPYPDVRAVTEESVPMPTSPYSISKLAGEHYVKYASLRGLPFTVLRPTNTYGRPVNLPDEARGYFVEKAILGMLEKPRRLLQFDGDGGSLRRWMYYTDHVSAYLAVIDNNSKTMNQVYNVAPNEKAVSLFDVVELLKGMTDFHGEVVWNRKPRPLEPNHIDIDPHKIYAHLQWRAKVPLKDGLPLVVKYWREKLMVSKR